MRQIHVVNEASKVVEFMSQLLKNPFKRNDVNIKNLHPQYADIVGDPKLSINFVYLFMYSCIHFQSESVACYDMMKVNPPF